MLQVLRLMLSLFILCLLSIVIATHIGNRPQERDAIAHFFDMADDCDIAPCFLGIVPNQSSKVDVYRLLNASPLVDSVDPLQDDIGESRLVIPWNGTQPNFMTRNGYVTFSADFARLIVLDPDLTLGEMLLALGEPSQIHIMREWVSLRYYDSQLVVESALDCDGAIFYSQVQVIYRPRLLQSPTNTINQGNILDAC
ncbi:MAG: hypothetical protein AAF846_19130 [Chloroflexota bacterium]